MVIDADVAPDAPLTARDTTTISPLRIRILRRSAPPAARSCSSVAVKDIRFLRRRSLLRSRTVQRLEFTTVLCHFLLCRFAVTLRKAARAVRRLCGEPGACEQHLPGVGGATASRCRANWPATSSARGYTRAGWSSWPTTMSWPSRAAKRPGPGPLRLAALHPAGAYASGQVVLKPLIQGGQRSQSDFDISRRH